MVMDYQFDITLEQRAAIAYSLYLWNLPDIKRKTRLFFHKKKINGITGKKEERWAAITREVLKKIEHVTLPQSTSLEIGYIVQSLGFRIYQWVGYVTRNLKFNVQYAFDICWTPYGTIDQKKIFETKWKNDQKLMTENKTLWLYVACGCADLSSANEIYLTLLESYNKNNEVVEFFIPNRMISLLIFTKEYHLLRKNKAGALEIEALQDADLLELYVEYKFILAVDLFRICVLEGLIDGVKYYWKEMKKVDRKKNVIFAVKFCMKNFEKYHTNNMNGTNKSARRYKCERYLEIIVFLFSKLSDKQLSLLFKLYRDDISTKILDFFIELTGWPWAQFFVITFQRVVKVIVSSWAFFTWDVFNSLLEKLEREYDLGYDMNNSIYQKLFRLLWYALPSNEKTEDIEDNMYFKYEVLDKLLHIQDIKSLQLIFHDEDLVSYKNTLIDFCVGHFEHVIEDGNFDFLDRFLNEVLESKEERDMFLQKIDVCDKFVQSEQFEVIDKFLAWRYSSVEDRQRRKNEIDIVEQCKIFMNRRNYDSMRNFLRWHLDK